MFNCSPPKCYILHSHGENGLFTLYLIRKLHEKSKKWKILNFINAHYSSTMQSSKLWLKMGSHWVLIDWILVRNNGNYVINLLFKEKWCTTKQFTSIIEIFGWKFWQSWNSRGRQGKLSCFDHQDSYILHSHV